MSNHDHGQSSFVFGKDLWYAFGVRVSCVLSDPVVDSLVHDPDTLRFLIKKMTPEKIMLGSDYPFPLGEHQPGKMIDGMDDLEDEVKRKLLGQNACEFLDIKQEDYL